METYFDIDPSHRQLFNKFVNMFTFISVNVIENKNKYEYVRS